MIGSAINVARGNIDLDTIRSYLEPNLLSGSIRGVPNAPSRGLTLAEVDLFHEIVHTMFISFCT